MLQRKLQIHSHKERVGNVHRNLFFDRLAEQKKFFDKLAQQLGYHSMDDWYNVTVEDINRHGGSTLLMHYNGSPSKALQCVYPEHNWMMWRFVRTPKGFQEHFLHNLEEKKRLLSWISQKLSIA